MGSLSLGAFNIDMDPLAITAALGKLIDHRLVDRQPIRHAEFAPVYSDMFAAAISATSALLST